MAGTRSSRRKAIEPEGDSRTRLLDASIVAFAETGFEGTRLRTIATRAGVAFPLIAYYFGSKHDLWLAAVDQILSWINTVSTGLQFDTTRNLDEQFRDHIVKILVLHIDYPYFRKIVTQEYLSNGERLDMLKPTLSKWVNGTPKKYFQRVIDLGIVTHYSAEDCQLIFAGVNQGNVLRPYEVELVTRKRVGSKQSVALQADLVFRVLTRREPPASS